MENVVPVSTLAHKRSMAKIAKEMGVLFASVGEVYIEFQVLAERNFGQAVDQLPVFIQKMRSINKCPEGLMDGPNQDWIIPLFDMFGEQYPNLEAGIRHKILRHCINYLDGINTDYAQRHVATMSHPLLIGDIMLARGRYWPGVKSQGFLIEGFDSVSAIEKVKTEKLDTFWFSVAMMWGTVEARLPVRRWYYKTYKARVNSSVSFAASIVGGQAEGEVKKIPTKPLAVAIQHELGIFEPTLHTVILEEVAKKQWISPGT